MPHARAILAAHDLWQQAQRPLILVGNGVIRAQAAPALAAFARQRQIPVVHTFMSKGMVHDDDPHGIGRGLSQWHDGIRSPFGGFKRSGYGRERSSCGLHAFINIQTVWNGAPQAASATELASEYREKNHR